MADKGKENPEDIFEEEESTVKAPKAKGNAEGAGGRSPRGRTPIYKSDRRRKAESLLSGIFIALVVIQLIASWVTDQYGRNYILPFVFIGIIIAAYLIIYFAYVRKIK
jgi:hypothetical protein